MLLLNILMIIIIINIIIVFMVPQTAEGIVSGWSHP